MRNSSEKLVVNIIGQAGVGKSTSAERMAELFGGSVHRPSDVIRDYANQHDIKLKYRADYVKCNQKMLVDNPNAMVQPVLDNSNSLVIVDGLRVVAHSQQLRAALGMRSIALEASLAIRFRNIREAEEWRGYRDEHLTSEAALLADEAVDNDNADPSEPNVHLLMAEADHTIRVDENTTLEMVHLEQAFVIGHWLRH